MQKKYTEKDIEVYLRDRVKAIGGKAYKWCPRGNTGLLTDLCASPEALESRVDRNAREENRQHCRSPSMRS
jgi:hypothetical protein